MPRQRPRKVTLRHVYRDARYAALEVWCVSLACNGGTRASLPIGELLAVPGITEETRLDEIEARLTCRACGARGEVDLRADVCSQAAPAGTAMSIEKWGTGAASAQANGVRAATPRRSLDPPAS